MENPRTRSASEDPRRLGDLLGRAHDLASRHALRSVVVGMAGFEGDPRFPEVVDFVESALRVDDTVFRMTRERAVLLLTDVDRAGAEEILERLLDDFRERFPAVQDPKLSISYFEVRPGAGDVTVKAVLPSLFPARASAAPA